jgi:phosphate acetyltransferase
MTRVLMLIPLEAGSGTTCVSLGICLATQRLGVAVNFFKPIAQPDPGYMGPERSTSIIRQATTLVPPDPLSQDEAEDLIAQHRLADLLELIVERCKRGTIGAELVVVEGLAPTPEQPFATRVNNHVAKALGAEIVLVTHPDPKASHNIRERLELALSEYGGARQNNIVGFIVNKVGAPASGGASVSPALEGPGNAPIACADTMSDTLQSLGNNPLAQLGCIPWNAKLVAPRVADLAQHLAATVEFPGEINDRRISSVVFCSRSVPNMIRLFQPGALLVTSGDRPDVLTTICLAAMNGTNIACVLLTGGIPIDPQLAELCESAARSTQVPVLMIETDTWETAQRLQDFSSDIPPDDLERIELIGDFFANHLNQQWIESLSRDSARAMKLSPPAFRYHLVELARAVERRIVLPEGLDPRTIKAAAICAERGIAVPVLLGPPEDVRRIARQQGVELNDKVEIIDPDDVRERYVGPMLELRKHKGLEAVLAREQLLDTVVLGTMMLALDEVDGLVSGAAHTTANTIRPALQLIKNAPGANLVSSIFFMLLPDQVLIYGDCAINPNPDAQQLADIAIQSANSAAAFGIEPRVAMISYSTGASGSGSDVEKVREATRIARQRCPDLSIDGPLQYDAAAIESVARSKAPDSPVAGQATVFIFPDLNTGNTTYKAVQRSANLVSIGPMLQGMRKPVNDLSRGALVDDIVYTIALTAIQANQIAAAADKK